MGIHVCKQLASMNLVPIRAQPLYTGSDCRNENKHSLGCWGYVFTFSWIMGIENCGQQASKNLVPIRAQPL